MRETSISEANNVAFEFVRKSCKEVEFIRQEYFGSMCVNNQSFPILLAISVFVINFYSSQSSSLSFIHNLCLQIFKCDRDRVSLMQNCVVWR